MSPEEVLLTGIKPLQDAVATYGQRQYETATLGRQEGQQLEVQRRSLENQKALELMKVGMFLNRADTMAKARVESVRQAGVNKQIESAVQSIRQNGGSPPPRNSPQTPDGDSQYIDNLNRYNDTLTTSRITSTTAAIKGALLEGEKWYGKKQQLDSMVAADATPIARAKSDPTQFVAANATPDQQSAFDAAVKSGKPPELALVAAGMGQQYQTYAQGVFEQTKNALLSAKGYGEQLKFINNNIAYQQQLIKTSGLGADTQGRQVVMPWFGKAVEDATTQFMQEKAKLAPPPQDAAAKAAQDALVQQHAKAIADKIKQTAGVAPGATQAPPLSVGESLGGQKVDTSTPIEKSPPNTKEDALTSLGMYLDSNNQLQKIPVSSSIPFVHGNGGPVNPGDVEMAQRIVMSPHIPWKTPRPGLPGAQAAAPSPSQPGVPSPASVLNVPAPAVPSAFTTNMMLPQLPPTAPVQAQPSVQPQDVLGEAPSAMDLMNNYRMMEYATQSQPPQMY